MNSRINDELPRTNNNINDIEEWHRRMQANVASHQTPKYMAISQYSETWAGTKQRRHLMIAGESAQPQRWQYQDSAARIHAIVQDFENRHVLDFLWGIAHNLQF